MCFSASLSLMPGSLAWIWILLCVLELDAVMSVVHCMSMTPVFLPLRAGLYGRIHCQRALWTQHNSVGKTHHWSSLLLWGDGIHNIPFEVNTKMIVHSATYFLSSARFLTSEPQTSQILLCTTWKQEGTASTPQWNKAMWGLSSCMVTLSACWAEKKLKVAVQYDFNSKSNKPHQERDFYCAWYWDTLTWYDCDCEGDVALRIARGEQQMPPAQVSHVNVSFKFLLAMISIFLPNTGMRFFCGISCSSAHHPPTTPS